MTATGFHVNPFPGIRSYDISEDEIFFGRELQIEELVSKLALTRFLAVVGSSGCGKSSLIRAGLIPALVRNKTAHFTAGWHLHIIKPGNDPVGNLASGLSNKKLSPDRALQLLRSGPDGISLVLRELNHEGHSLLVIDQFEELFRYKNPQTDGHSADDARFFTGLLINAIRNKDFPVYVVLTMRTDFLDDCTEFRGLSEAINMGYYLVPRMNDDERRLAITGPVHYKKAEITPELIDQLLQDVGDNPDQLPIMQHALMRTWNYWSLHRIGDQPVGREHYEAIGTMKEALSIHLEEIYEELRESRLKFIAEKLFKALTDVGQDNRGIRRPATLQDLCTLTEANEEEVIRVIDAFREPGRAFLMPPNHVRLNPESTIDISHESIMRVWKRLRGWVEEQNQSAQLYLRLAKSAELYQQGKTGLWVNPELQLALQWRELNKPNVTWAMRYDPSFDRAIAFLDKSKQQHDLEVYWKEEQQRRNLKRARIFAIVLGAASLVSILFLVISLNLRFKAEASRKEAMEKQSQAEAERKRTVEQRKEAIRQKRISEQQQEIAEQQKIITEQQRQYAVAQQLVAQSQTKIALEERHKADAARGEAILARDDAFQQRMEALSQKMIADRERDKAEASEQHATRLRLLAIARSLAIQSAQMSGSLQDDLPALLALQAYRINDENGGNPYDADIFRALSLNASGPQVLRGHKDAVRGLASTADGKKLYSCSDDGQILIWHPASSPDARVFPLPKQVKEKFRALTLTGKDNMLAAGTFSGKIYLFMPTGTHQILEGHTAVVHDLASSPDMNLIYSAGADGRVIRWSNNSDGYVGTVIDSSSNIIRTIAVNPEGNRIAWGGDDGCLHIVPGNPQNNETVRKLSLPTGIFSLAYSPGGRYLAAGLSDGSIRIYDNNDPDKDPVEILGSHKSGILSIGFSPDGDLLFSGGYDRSVTFQHVDSPEEKPAEAGRQESWVYRVLASPQGNQVISCGADKTIMICNIQSTNLAKTLAGKVKRNLTPAEWDKYIGSDIPFQKTVTVLP